jgi:signal transduction histidine kinase
MMTRADLLLMALTGIVLMLAAVLAAALMRLFAVSRALGRGREAGAEAAFMTAALEAAVQRLRGDERAAQARAEASERLSEEIIASMTSGLLVTGEDHRVRTLNPAGAKMLGLPPGAAGELRDVLVGAGPLADVIEECLAKGQPIFRRTVHLPHGAASAHLGVTVSPISVPGGRAHGAICLFSDLTAIVQLEDQLRLRDSLARLGEMTAGIAHEFRNSLATIHGYARLLDLERLPPEFRPYVLGIRDETDTLRAVVTNFLQFARPAQLSPALLDTRALVERAADDIRGEMTARGGRVTIGGEFAGIEGDEVLLRQAFSNLCRNALEACLSATVPPDIRVEGAVDAALGQQRIAVTDNGAGIDPILVDRIFQPFFTTKPSGTGLGLALVQKIIVTHNGRVAVESTPGAGSRFVVVLPLVARP